MGPISRLVHKKRRALASALPLLRLSGLQREAAVPIEDRERVAGVLTGHNILVGDNLVVPRGRDFVGDDDS